MLSFWVLIGLLTCAATALVVWPLFRRTAPVAGEADDEARRLAIYRDRRREIEREREAGRLTAEEAARAIDELVGEAAVQFPQAAAGLGQPAGRSSRSGAALSWAVVSAIAVPVLAALVYSAVGSPSIVGLDSSALHGELTQERIAQAVEELRKQVVRNPQDAEAWAMLAEALRLQDQPAEAAKAYEKAVELEPRHARLLADYAETLVLLSHGDFVGKPVELLERALRIDPSDGKAIALMGAAQYRLGNLPEALRLLKLLAREMPPESVEASRMSEAIARIEGELAAQGGPAAAPAPGGAGRTEQPSSSGVATPPTSTEAAVSGEITIDPGLRSSLLPGAVLFVVARDLQGPRTPLAALRQPVGEWPARFRLDELQSMDPSRRMSAASSLVIEARVSASGDAMRRSGDPIGASAPVAPGASGVAIRIDRRVP